MGATFVSAMLVVAVAYLIIGTLFTIVFQLKGIGKVDENAHVSSIGFRIIIIPGCILLWPVLLGKWVGAKSK